jgi:RNA polymerase sigma factor (TIGR02999 family)
MSDSSNLSAILAAVTQGDHAQSERLLEFVYDDLRELARRQLRRESANHTLDPTALVHEVYLKLARHEAIDWNGRTHFYAVCAQAMRHILVDYARTKKRQKRGGAYNRVLLQERMTISPESSADVLAVDEAIEKLARLNELHATIVELRFFGGMTIDEVAAALGTSKRTVERQWTGIRAWLRRELGEESC